MTGPTASPRRASLILLAIVFAALMIGVAANLLLTARSAAPPPVGPSSEILLPGWAIAVLLGAFAGLFFVPLLILAFSNRRNQSTGRFATAAVAIVLAMVIAIAVLRLLGPGAVVVQPSTATGNNSSSGTNTSTPMNNTPPLASGGGTIVPFHYALPGWVWLAVTALAIGVVTVVVAPTLYEAFRTRRELRAASARDAEASARLREALQRTDTALSLDGDPREVIRRLYREILLRIEPLSPNLTYATPDEIREAHLVRLGISPETATELTRLFEEARYSSHSLAPTAADQARKAVRAALADLKRGRSAE